LHSDTLDLGWWTGHLRYPVRALALTRYYGGKGLLAGRIVALLPWGRVYVEPYCGAASVFWHLPRPYPVEVLNDIDQRLVNLFRVLQDPQKFDQFAWRVLWTPYSLAEFERALGLLDSEDDVEAAWAYYVVANQGMAGHTDRPSRGNWGRTFVSRGGSADTTRNWRRKLTQLRYWHDRLMRVQLDCRDALEVIRYWDSEDTVFYIDPPYIAETRADARGYRHEADLDHHQQLVELLLSLRGSAVVSGYDHHVYRPLEEAGWEKLVIPTAAAAAVRNRWSGLQGEGAAIAKVPRQEVIWRRVGRHQMRML
jgi:DNA adenine methylase